MTTLLVAGSARGIVGRCDAKCYEAEGPDCDCICGGRNHGAGRARAIERTKALADPTGELREQMEAMGGTKVVSLVVGEELELPLRDVDWDRDLADDELRATLPAEELAPLLIDAAATVDLDAREAERLGRKDEAATLDQLRDELVAEAFDGGHPVEAPMLEWTKSRCAGRWTWRAGDPPYWSIEEPPEGRTHRGAAEARRHWLDQEHSDRAGDWELWYSTPTTWLVLSFHPSLEAAQAAAEVILSDPVRMHELNAPRSGDGGAVVCAGCRRGGNRAAAIRRYDDGDFCVDCRGPIEPDIECAGPEERRVAPGPPQVAEERPAPHADAPSEVDLRAPYTPDEWTAITAALKTERERRSKRGAPFTQADQVAVIHEVVRPMRTAALNAEAR